MGSQATVLSELKHIVQHQLEQWRPFNRLWIAFSGGLDSTALLLTLCGRDDVTALHINHGLAAQADQWQSHCQQVAEQLGIGFKTLSATVDQRGKGMEHAARDARYEAFRQCLGVDDLLLTAHHLDDQAETTLLNLLRGAGPLGLGGIPAIRRIGQGRIGRPLLTVAHQTLQRAVTEAGLPYLIDPSNLSTKVPRNWLRHEVLPRIRQHWPSAATTICRSAQLSRQTQTVIDQQSDLLLDAVAPAKSNRLPLGWLAKAPRETQAALLRRWLQRLDLPPPHQRQLDELLRQCTARSDAQMLVEWPGCQVRRYRDLLFAHAPLAQAPGDWERPWRNRKLDLPSPLGSLVWQGKGPWPELTVRFRRGGERLRPAGQPQSQRLKHLFQQAGIPPWERARTPLLFLGDELVAVAGQWVSASFAAQLRRNALALSWQQS